MNRTNYLIIFCSIIRLFQPSYVIKKIIYFIKKIFELLPSRYLLCRLRHHCCTTVRRLFLHCHLVSGSLHQNFLYHLPTSHITDSYCVSFIFMCIMYLAISKLDKYVSQETFSSDNSLQPFQTDTSYVYVFLFIV